MVEIIEKGIKLKKAQVDEFCLRLSRFLLDAFRDSKDQILTPIDERVIEFEYKIKS